MSSKSMYKGQESWKPAGFSGLSPAGREKVREQKKAILARRAAERLAAREALKAQAKQGATIDGVALTDVMATMEGGTP